VEQPNRFLLTVNLRTARALGLVLPPAVLLRAEKVLE
jgi:putative ABC transport system substrate-binding protein